MIERRRDTRAGTSSGQIAIRFGKKVFFYRPFVFFKRTFNPVHVMAVSIGHGGYNSVIAMSLPAKK